MMLFFVFPNVRAGLLQKLLCCFSASAVHPTPREGKPALSVVPSTGSIGDETVHSVDSDKVEMLFASFAGEPQEARRLEDNSDRWTVVSLRPLTDDHAVLRRTRKVRTSTSGTYAQDSSDDSDLELIVEDIGSALLSPADFERSWLRVREDVHGFKQEILNFRRRFTLACGVGLFLNEPVDALDRYKKVEEMYAACLKLAETLGMGAHIISPYSSYPKIAALPVGDYKIQYLAGKQCLIDGCSYRYQYAEFKPKCLLCRKNAISAIYNDTRLDSQKKLYFLAKLVEKMSKSLAVADNQIPIGR